MTGGTRPAAHQANLLGALVTGLHDLLGAAMVNASGSDATGVATLLLVQAHPGLSITESAAALQLTHSGAVRSVDRLAARGLVERGDGRDRRSHGLRLTAAGQALARTVLEARRQALGAVLQPLTEHERAVLGQGLAKMLAALPHTPTDAWRICRTCEHEACQGPDCPVGSAVRALQAPSGT